LGGLGTANNGRVYFSRSANHNQLCSIVMCGHNKMLLKDIAFSIKRQIKSDMEKVLHRALPQHEGLKA